MGGWTTARRWYGTEACFCLLCSGPYVRRSVSASCIRFSALRVVLLYGTSCPLVVSIPASGSSKNMNLTTSVTLPLPPPRPPQHPKYHPLPLHFLAQGLTLAYSLRRYAGINSYVLPHDPNLPDYCADMGVSDKAAARIAAAAAAPVNHRRPFGARSAVAGKHAKSSGVGHHARGDAAGAGGHHNRGAGNGRMLSALPAGGESSGGDVGGAGSGVPAVGGGGGGDGRGAAVGAATDSSGGLGYSVTSAASLMQRLREPELRSQFRELAARGGRFFWTPEQCPPELVVLVVDGRRQAELMEPLYRSLVDAAGANAGDSAGGAEVFIALVS